METKFKLQLGTIHNVEELKTALINGITYEFIVDMVHVTLRSFHKETDMSKLVDEFVSILESNMDETYTSFYEWSLSKTERMSEVMEFVARLDEYMFSNGKMAQGQVVADFQTKLAEFLITVSNVKITMELLDFGKLEIKEDYVKSTIEELEFVNEAKLLSTLVSMDLDMTPIDMSECKNSVVEEKLNNLNKIISSCENLFENDSEKLNDQVLSMQEKFYNICYESLTDGEKAEKARKVIKQMNSHRNLLDKLENKLTQAHELSRQLILHKKRLGEAMDAKREDSINQIKINPYQREMIEFEMESANFVTNNYLSQIDNQNERLDAIKEKISEQYNVLDKLDNALKFAVPSENDLKKFSSIAFKFQELCVRLELSKSQISKDNKELFELIKAANMGLSTLIAYAIDAKDLFIRNSLMTASFKAVNARYDLVDNPDKATELAQIKFVTDKLSNYAETYEIFAKQLSDYRRVGNNIIRDLSIIMGRPFNGTGLFEIINTIDIGIQQLKLMLESLSNNNDKQRDILNSILTL